MGRPFDGDRLVLASHNPKKLAEMSGLFEGRGVALIGADELGLPEPEETGATFVENATLKAVVAAQGSGLPSLADDSGLAVNALLGAPGVYSARWGGPARDFDAAMTRVHTALGETRDPSAAFICVLALAWPDGHVEHAQGSVEGSIVWPPRGDGGFGYDPIFQPNGWERTFAEADQASKDAISHRGRAMAALMEKCFSAR